MLKRITTHDVEPADLDVPLAPRLNVLAGDNGVGKTFVLDLAWWAATESWSENPAVPKRGEGVRPTICGGFDEPKFDALHGGVQSFEARFDFEDQRWRRAGGLGRRLVVYAKANGGFDIWDSFRKPREKALFDLEDVIASRRSYFSPDAVWNGLSLDDKTVRCNGLLRDWLTWQFQKPELLILLSRVLAKLSPHSGEVLKPGPPRRVSIEDARDIPTIILPYGNVPVTHASAGMRRVLALAYVLVWTWHEHTEAARLTNVAPLADLVLLIDEVDAHLHPTWQRVILPALFGVFPEIEGSLRVQVIASTHAPLVLASVETLFDEERDKLLHFALRDGTIAVDEIPWAKQGDAVNWLVSETFGLPQGRSREAERTIEAAEAFMRGDPAPPGLDTRETIHAELLRVLGGHDDFWPRWLVETGIVK